MASATGNNWLQKIRRSLHSTYNWVRPWVNVAAALTFLQARAHDPEQRERAVDFTNEMVTMRGAMKTLMAVLMLSAVLSMQPGAVAWAGLFDGATFSVQQGGGAQGKGGREARQQAREARPVQAAPPPRERARGQLTDEERRQLHRDLDKANRELYRERRP